MTASTDRYRRGAVWDISIFICVIDLVYGMVSPTFSLFVKGLGGSTLLIGLLAAVVGLTRLVGSFPIGVISDHVGRRTVLVTGAALFCTSCALFTACDDPAVLLAPRALFGLAILATFPLGVAYIVDVVPAGKRTAAIGIYTSAQGLGYAIGPVLATLLANALGYAFAYRVAACLAALVAVFGWRKFQPPTKKSAMSNAGRALATGRVFHGGVAAASVANTGMMLMFSGAVLPFLSLYASEMGLSTVGVGALYASRAAASTIARLPAATLARSLSNTHVMFIAVAVDAFAAFGIFLSRSDATLVSAALLDGVAFGTFLASSQSSVAERSAMSNQGAAIGAYAAAGAFGETAGAFCFGAIAHFFGIHAIFALSGASLLACLSLAFRLNRDAPVLEPSNSQVKAG